MFRKLRGRIGLKMDGIVGSVKFCWELSKLKVEKRLLILII